MVNRTRAAIWNYEHGAAIPLTTAAGIAAALDVPLVWLATGEGSHGIDGPTEPPENSPEAA